ncbi:MAG: MFS transporter [Lachnospiraceae bacterium]|nr:MFS transporter [Lachnospiraceae bacterium]
MDTSNINLKAKGLRGFNIQHTLFASFIGYVVQAIGINFAPLLFLTFQRDYEISIEKITFLVTINFVIQLLMDALSTGFVDKIGYKASAVIAHFFSATGLFAMAFLPGIMEDKYLGLLIATFLYAIGGGLIEVVVSPIVEALPIKKKAATMSLLHSFYSWGHAAVVIVSALFFLFIGIDKWEILAVIWGLVPFFNAFFYMCVPVYHLDGEEKGIRMGKLFRMKFFWIMLVLMLGAGAAEQAVSQWASVFAEMGLGVSKTVGDIAGPCTFAILMGISRVFYAKCGSKVNLSIFMLWSGVLCLFGYLLAALSPIPVIGLIGCAICGLSVGIMWPGTFNLAAGGLKGSTTGMFAVLALAGDAGCTLGPTLVGMVSGRMNNSMQAGILTATVFPTIIIIFLLLYKREMRTKAKD